MDDIVMSQLDGWCLNLELYQIIVRYYHELKNSFKEAYLNGLTYDFNPNLTILIPNMALNLL